MQHFSEYSSSSVQRGVIDSTQETNDRVRDAGTSQRDYRKSKEDACQRQPFQGAKLSNEWCFRTCKRTSARESSVQTWEPWVRSTCVSRCNPHRRSTRTLATGQDVDFQILREKKLFLDAGTCPRWLHSEPCKNQGTSRRSCGNGSSHAGEIHVNAHPNSSLGDPAAGAPNDGYNRLSELRYRSANGVRNRGKIAEVKSPITRKNIGCGVCEAALDRLFADVALQVVVNCSTRDADAVTSKPAGSTVALSRRKTPSKKSSKKAVLGQMKERSTETSRVKKKVVVKKRSNIGSSKIRKASVKSSSSSKKKKTRAVLGKKVTDGESSTHSTKKSADEGGVKSDLHVATHPVLGLQRVCVDVMTDDDLRKHNRILCTHSRPVASLTKVPSKSEDKNSVKSEEGESVIASDCKDEISTSTGGGQKNDDNIDKVEELESKDEISEINIEADVLNKVEACSSKCTGITQLKTYDKLQIKSGSRSSKKQTEYASTSLEENQEAVTRDSTKKKSVAKKPRKARQSSRSDSCEQDEDFPKRKIIQSKQLHATEIQKVKTERSFQKYGQKPGSKLREEKLETVTDETVTTDEKSTTAGKSRTTTSVTDDEPSLASLHSETVTRPKSGKLASRRREVSSVMTIWHWLRRKRHRKSRTPAEIPLFGTTSSSSESHDNQAAKDPFLCLFFPEIASDFPTETAGDSKYGTSSFDEKAACASLSKVNGRRGLWKVSKAKVKY